MAVHDVEVEPISARFFDAMNLGFELRKIGRENRGSDEDARHWSNGVMEQWGNVESGFPDTHHSITPLLHGIPLDDRGLRFMLSRSEAASLDWNAVERPIYISC